MVDIPFQHVTEDQPWSPPFTVEWNSVIDAAIANKLQQTRTQRNIFGGLAQQTLTVLASNESNVDIAGFDIAVLKSPMWTAAENLEFFQYQGAMSASTPTTTDRGKLFGVATEETPKGFTAPFQINGLARVRLNVLHAAHDYADIDPMNRTQLKSGFSGSAKIVWQEVGTGIKWAIVQLGLLDEHEIKAITDQPIDFDSFGNASVWRKGIDSGATEVLWLNWMHNSEPIPVDCQVLARWFVDERKWVIVGAECKTSDPPTPQPTGGCDAGDWFDDFNYININHAAENNWLPTSFTGWDVSGSQMRSSGFDGFGRIFRCGPDVGPIQFFGMETAVYLPPAGRFSVLGAGLMLVTNSPNTGGVKWIIKTDGINKIVAEYIINGWATSFQIDEVDITNSFVDGKLLRFEMEYIDAPTPGSGFSPLIYGFYRYRFFYDGVVLFEFDTTEDLLIEFIGNMNYGYEYSMLTGGDARFDFFRSFFA
jgi:hypothetical protein